MHIYPKTQTKSRCCDRYVCCNTIEAQIFKDEPRAENSVTSIIWGPQWKASKLLCYDETTVALNLSQVYERLQKVNVTMSHQVTVRLLTDLGKLHDEDVKVWQESITKSLTTKLQQVQWKCMGHDLLYLQTRRRSMVHLLKAFLHLVTLTLTHLILELTQRVSLLHHIAPLPQVSPVVHHLSLRLRTLRKEIQTHLVGEV